MILGLGLAGGMVGALFIRLNVRLSKWRRRVVLGRRGYRVAEVAFVAALTAVTACLLPRLAGSCRNAPPEWACSARQNDYYCGDYGHDAGARNVTCAYECWDRAVYGRGGCPRDEFDPAATLSLRSSDDVIKALFHDDDAVFGGTALLSYALAAFLLAAITCGPRRKSKRAAAPPPWTWIFLG